VCGPVFILAPNSWGDSGEGEKRGSVNGSAPVGLFWGKSSAFGGIPSKNRSRINTVLDYEVRVEWIGAEHELRIGYGQQQSMNCVTVVPSSCCEVEGTNVAHL